MRQLHSDPARNRARSWPSRSKRFSTLHSDHPQIPASRSCSAIRSATLPAHPGPGQVPGSSQRVRSRSREHRSQHRCESAPLSGCRSSWNCAPGSSGCHPGSSLPARLPEPNRVASAAVVRKQAAEALVRVAASREICGKTFLVSDWASGRRARALPVQRTKIPTALSL